MVHGCSGGRELDETITVARKLKEIGIDTLHLRNGCYDTMNLLIPTDYQPDALSIADAERVRKEVGLQVISDGNLSDPDLAEKLLTEHKLDFVGEARALFADPRWAEKARAGKKEEILPCIRCNQCLNRIFFGSYAACAVNPRTGTEYLGPLLQLDNQRIFWWLAVAHLE
jgi:2-enoate reductase